VALLIAVFPANIVGLPRKAYANFLMRNRYSYQRITHKFGRNRGNCFILFQAGKSKWKFQRNGYGPDDSIVANAPPSHSEGVSAARLLKLGNHAEGGLP